MLKHNAAVDLAALENSYTSLWQADLLEPVPATATAVASDAAGSWPADAGVEAAAQHRGSVQSAQQEGSTPDGTAAQPVQPVEQIVGLGTFRQLLEELRQQQAQISALPKTVGASYPAPHLLHSSLAEPHFTCSWPC